MLSEALELSTGLVLGAAVGATVLLTNFCALGGIADILFAKDWRRFRSWVLAAGIAIVGAHALDAAGAIPLDRATSLAPYILWLPALLGGLMFGFGMALGGGCISRGLARIGAGSLKSLAIIVVIGLSAAATLTLLAPLQTALGRTAVLETFGPGGLHRIFGNLPFVGPETVRWTFVTLLGGGALWFALKDAWFRASRDALLGGLIIGAVIVAAWFVAGRLFEARGGDSFTAINFVPPLGEAVLAIGGRAPALFPLAVTLGVPIGALAAALLTGNLALDRFTQRADLVHSLIGGALMGVGGTVGLGCTFGQGLSGVATLSPTSFIAVAGIICGCIWGIRYHEAGSVWGGLRLALSRG
ncbi:MAG: YeeE/YedE family protein [Rhodospirillaceae bacterium]